MSHTDNMIPYENLNILNKEFEIEFQEKFKQFLDKGWYILGNEVKAFEESYAQYCGTSYCIGVANGLDALILGLQVFNFPKKSEIIVPSNTYIATILAIINAGHIPVLVEPDPVTYNINPDAIEAKITNKVTRQKLPNIHAPIMPNMFDGIIADIDKTNDDTYVCISLFIRNLDYRALFNFFRTEDTELHSYDCLVVGGMLIKTGRHLSL